MRMGKIGNFIKVLIETPQRNRLSVKNSQLSLPLCVPLQIHLPYCYVNYKEQYNSVENKSINMENFMENLNSSAQNLNLYLTLINKKSIFKYKTSYKIILKTNI